jgi:ribosomal protein S18 acetylase RimI-like enzyme
METHAIVCGAPSWSIPYQGTGLSFFMDFELLGLSQLDEDGINRLAALHHSVMQTLLSDLGLPMVLRYYQVARDDRSVIGICAVSPSGEMLGWALGSPHPDLINSRLSTPFTWFLSQMLRLTLIRPLVLWQLISSVLGSSGHPNMKSGAIELTYIGVAPNQRNKGLGRELLDAFREASRSAGHRSIVLSVEMENAPAIALYEKKGFKIVQTFSEGRYQRHRMELVLA